jgi:hypothetical protein
MGQIVALLIGTCFCLCLDVGVPAVFDIVFASPIEKSGDLGPTGADLSNLLDEKQILGPQPGSVLVCRAKVIGPPVAALARRPAWNVSRHIDP